MRVPLMLEMAGQPVVCVGAGPVAAAKVAPLLRAGARVTVVAPDVAADLSGAHTVRHRAYRSSDLAGDPPPRLVVAATGDPAVDGQVAGDAAARGLWCLRVDGAGDVAVPAVVRRGDLVVAMATGAPALTRRLRQTLDGVLGDRWEAASTVLAGLRADQSVRAALAQAPPEVRRERWRRAVDAVLAEGPMPEDRLIRGILTGDEPDGTGVRRFLP